MGGALRRAACLGGLLWSCLAAWAQPAPLDGPADDGSTAAVWRSGGSLPARPAPLALPLKAARAQFDLAHGLRWTTHLSADSKLTLQLRGAQVRVMLAVRLDGGP